MKRLVIRPPRIGQSNAYLLTHRYLNKQEAQARGVERGTYTVYLGSFSKHLNPDSLADVTEIRAGETRHGVSLKTVTVGGVPFYLQRADIELIRTWLREHGTHTELQQRASDVEERRSAALRDLRTNVEAEVRASLTEALRAELMEELKLKFESEKLHPIDAAVRAVEAAGQAVRAESERLQKLGYKPSVRRGRAGGATESPFQLLLERTLLLRHTALADFEASCKAAGLMSRTKRAAKSRANS